MKHILLVKDDLSMLNDLSFAIKKQGYALDIARTRDGQKQFMFLTAMDEETDMIMGLDIGGDDYITKPFKLAVFCPGSMLCFAGASTSSISGMGTERDHKYSGVL